MKQLNRIAVACLLVAAAISCSKPVVANLTMLTSSLSFIASGASQDISFKTNQNWTITADEPWVTAAPASGQASDSYLFVTVTAAANTETAERTATLTVKAGEKTGEVRIKQAGKPAATRLTISEFRKKSANETTWYELSGEIAAIESEEYGNFYLFDETGYVYVYGLCATQRKKGDNDQSFPQLELKPGDKVTMMTLRSEYQGLIEAGGQTPAYFVSKTPGTYKLGRKVASTTAGWMELPATSGSDQLDLLIHTFPDGQRNYSAYYDYDNLVSHWVAYPLFAGNIGSGERTDKFMLDPLVPREKQQYLPSGYKEGNAGMFDRGHQLPSADRLDFRANFEVFLNTNMTPQNHDLNGGTWEALENKVRKWARNSTTDTLYVVTGCTVNGNGQYALDGDGKHVAVPTAYYKALLRLDKNGNWLSAGFWLPNQSANGAVQKSLSMSIDDLEAKVGVDFFVNLPADVQAAVEAQVPAEEPWWWNN